MKDSNKKNKFNIANVLFGLSGLILLGYIGVCFLPITNDATVIQNMISMNSPVTGVIKQAMIANGQKTPQGTPILIIQPTQATSDYQEAVSQHQQAKMDISLIAQQIKVLQLDLTMASAELVRLQDEYIIHKSDNDLDSKLINQLSYSIKIQQSQVNKVKGQIAAAQVQLSKAQFSATEIDRNQAQALLDSHDVVIKAPTNGFVQNFFLESGVKVSEGQKLFDFVDTSQTLIKANFAETDLNKVHAGSQVLIFPRAYLGAKVFHGVVLNEDAVQVNAKTNPSNSNSATNAWLKQPERLPVLIKVLDSDDDYRLLSGMSAYIYVHG